LKGFTAAKQRLAGLLIARERAALAEAMAADILERLLELDTPLVVVTADATAEKFALRYGAQAVFEGAPGQTAAVEAGLRVCQLAGHASAATVSLDLPCLDAREVRALLEGDDAPGVAAVSDRHGTGTNALRLRPPDAISLHFGPDSLAWHRREAGARGCGFEVLPLPSLFLDLDEPDDVAAFLGAPVPGRTLSLLQELDAVDRLRRRASLAG
jgi:2-phospho-L-lactate guanylyltransferase